MTYRVGQEEQWIRFHKEELDFLELRCHTVRIIKPRMKCPEFIARFSKEEAHIKYLIDRLRKHDHLGELRLNGTGTFHFPFCERFGEYFCSMKEDNSLGFDLDNLLSWLCISKKLLYSFNILCGNLRQWLVKPEVASVGTKMILTIYLCGISTL
jgi:hypothetical protein